MDTEKTILDLRANEAAEFLFSHASYVNFDLPQYIDFREILEKARQEAKTGVGKSALDRAKKVEDVNHNFITNKDGKFAWRRLEIVNPLLYAALVNLITSRDNWLLIKRRLLQLRTGSTVECMSMPVLPKDGRTQSATQVSAWLRNVEGESIKQAMDYDYIYVSDITDCYGSIYTHSISWALHTKELAKARRGYKDLLGNKIDHHIQTMRHGQTNGIPQGSVLMDFIAEIVLAYADELLSDALRANNILVGIRIIRYRDDYRIFTNDTRQGDKIMKLLNEVLILLGMRLNVAKTKSSSDIITSAVKQEKVFFMDKPLKKPLTYQEMRRELLLAYKYSNLYPNSSQISKRIKALRDRYNPSNDEDKLEMVSILTSLAVNNPVCIPTAMAFASRILESLSPEVIRDTLHKIKLRLNQMPNCGYLEVWLQRLTLKLDPTIPYSEKLCQRAAGQSVKLFSEEWTDEPTAKAILEKPPINARVIDGLDFVISDSEVDLFREAIPS